MHRAPASVGAYRVIPIGPTAGAREFAAAGAHPYRKDPLWAPPLPGEERETFDPRRNPLLDGMELQRWVLLEGDLPVGRIAAFAPPHRPGVGYVGFFEAPDDHGAAQALLRVAESWLVARNRRECYGPIAVTPRDRIGMLIDGFEQPAMLFTPYNPPYYRALFEAAGWQPEVLLRAHGWDRDFADARGVQALAQRRAAGSAVTIRPLRVDRLKEETRIIARLINETLAEAWQFDPISDREADDMARLLRPILNPALALVADDEQGPCGVALGIPDVNWLWRRAGGSLWPLGWARALWHRRRIPQLRVMAFGLAERVQRSALAARLISGLIDAGMSGGYVTGELSQVFETNERMGTMLVRMGFPVTRRYAVFARHLEASPQ